MPRAIISTHNKTDLFPFMQALTEADWELFGTSGTQKAYRDLSGAEIASLEDLAASEGCADSLYREVVAQQISGLMLSKRIVQLACINLRPPRIETPEGSDTSVISLDVGGIAMISAAGNSGALVVTSPDSYADVLCYVSAGLEAPQDLRLELQTGANLHIAEHVMVANALTT